MPRALRPNWLCESRVQPWRGTEPVAVAPEQAQAVLAGTQLPLLLLLLRLLLSVSRGANFSNPNCCHKSLPLLLLLFAVCCLALFVSGRRSGLLLLLQMLLSSIAKESVWAKERKSVQARLATGPARCSFIARHRFGPQLVSSVPLSTCRIRNASYQRISMRRPKCPMH